MAENKTGSVTLENRKRIMITGVSEVVSQIDKCVVIKTSLGNLSISGSNLRVTKLNLEEGNLIVDGQIDALKYFESSSKGFFKRMFK